MNSVERVKSICKEKKIPISRLERDLGYSNGYIGQLRKGVFPTDRLVDIANYLNISTDFLLTGEETKKAPSENGEGEKEESIEEIKAAFWGGEKDLSKEDWDEMWEDVETFARFRAEQQRKKRNGVSD